MTTEPRRESSRSTNAKMTNMARPKRSFVRVGILLQIVRTRNYSIRVASLCWLLPVSARFSGSNRRLGHSHWDHPVAEPELAFALAYRWQVGKWRAIVFDLLPRMTWVMDSPPRVRASFVGCSAATSVAEENDERRAYGGTTLCDHGTNRRGL